MNDIDAVLKSLELMPPDKRDALIEKTLKTFEGVKFIPNPGPQSDAYYSKADVLLYGGQAGGGKEQSENSLVLTPTGWKRIGSLKVGDSICATDGTVSQVIGVYPQGEKDIYTVTMEDGGKTEAGLDHIWLAWRTHSGGKSANKMLSGEASARNWTTAQIMAEMGKGDRRDGRRRGFAIPVTEPVSFNVAGQLKGTGNFIKREIDPYLLGVLIGDGHLGERTVSVTSADEEIGDFVRHIAGDDVRVDEREGNKSLQYTFRRSFLKTISAQLTSLGLLGKKAVDKFIPRQYLLATVEERWELLRGLMDTDGWVEPKRCCYYTTVSKRLCDDVKHLAFSLGAIVTVSEKFPTYSYLGEKFSGQKAYCLRIKMPVPEQCFKLSRKKVIASEISHQSSGRLIKSIEFSRRCPAVCIRVSHRNSLYITDDFIVTHNTGLINGLALTQHRRSLIMRRKYADMSAIADDLIRLNRTRDGFTSMPRPKLKTSDDRLVEFGACQNLGDEEGFAGVPHDLRCFDEVTQFQESQFRYLMGWVRSIVPGQRCRVIAASNPPTSSTGDWVIGYWRPWLDLTHHNPAKPGELRWFVTDPDGKDMEVPDNTPIEFPGRKEKVIPKSRTFIPAKLSDNPYLVNTDYAATLDAMPEPLRSAMRDGNFMLSRKDDLMQAIPTEWVKQAQQRWESMKGRGVPMCAIGVDVSQPGGGDDTVLSIRYDGWFDNLIVVPAKSLKDEGDVAALILKHRRDGAAVIVDTGGGYGGATMMQLKSNDIPVVPYKGNTTTDRRTVDRTLGFANTRSAAIWAFREALDPSQPGGSPIALPNDAKLLADLTAPTFELVGKGFKIESKDSVMDRLGRSPDRGDAVVMAWWSGAKGIAPTHPAQIQRKGSPVPRKVIMGHQHQRKPLR